MIGVNASLCERPVVQQTIDDGGLTLGLQLSIGASLTQDGERSRRALGEERAAPQSRSERVGA